MRLSSTVKNQVADSEGQFVIVQGLLFRINSTFANLYAPNDDDSPQCINICFLEIDKCLNTHCVVGGDFNCTLSPHLDKSWPSGPTLKMSRVVQFHCDEQGLIDIRRKFKLNLTTKDDTLFSNPHGTYSRIDFFLITQTLSSSGRTRYY